MLETLDNYIHKLYVLIKSNLIAKCFTNLANKNYNKDATTLTLHVNRTERKALILCWHCRRFEAIPEKEPTKVV